MSEYKGKERPPWNQSGVATTSNDRPSFTRYGQENAGDSTNHKSANNNSKFDVSSKYSSSGKSSWEYKQHEKKHQYKDIKDTWVQQIETDDTVSISSHSNEISIGKSSSNTSDVSARSFQEGQLRYRSRNNDVKSDRGIESYQSSRASGQLASKLSSKNEGCGLKHSSSSEDETSTLNFSLEKLSFEDETSKLVLEKPRKDREEETSYSRTSLSEYKHRKPDTQRSSSEMQRKKEMEANLAQDHHESEKITRISSNTDGRQPHPDLTTRLSEKISNVPSTEFSYSYSYDVSEDLKASDLIASTLAECRLLLELSPPPTPIGEKSSTGRKNFVLSPVAKKEVTKEYAVSPVAKREASSKAMEKPISGATSPLSRNFCSSPKRINVLSPVGKTAKVEAKMDETIEILPTFISKAQTPCSSATSTASSPANSSTVSKGLGNFLKCPCCHKEFANKTLKYENRDRQPLHSFACDHIVCYECVFASSSIHMVSCPKCGEAKAFDKTKPVVSRSYCNLVKSIEILNSGKKSSCENARPMGVDEVKEDKREKNSAGDDKAVPQQIQFSPKIDLSLGEEVAQDIATNSSEKSNIEHTKKGPYISYSSMSGINTNTSAHPTDYLEEPKTPGSRAQFRFMQRKEKLAQSLERVNRLLEKSKMNRTEVVLKSAGEDFNENKDLNDGVIQTEAGKSGVTIDSTQNKIETPKYDGAEVTSKSEYNDEQRDTSNESIRVECDILDSTGITRPVVDTLWTDEAVRYRHPQEQSAQKRIKPELRVDTGNYTPPPQRKNPYLDLKDEPTCSSIDGTQTKLVNSHSNVVSSASQNKLVDFDPKAATTVNDIFRTSLSLPAMDFEILGRRISSEDSSLSGGDSDNRFLLGNNLSSKMGGNSLMKEKKYGLHRPSPLKDVKATAEKTRMDEHRCPQFLPSLTYSTMHESDELVGLVREKDSMSRRRGGSKMFSYSNSVTPSKIFTRQSKSCKSMRLSFGKVAESFDEGSLMRNQPYEFTQHSCSFSPSSLRGALVTHKPKLHKRIFSKLSFRRRQNPRLYSRS